MDRQRQDQELKQNGTQGIGAPWMTMETARHVAPAGSEAAKPEDKISLFWRVFGGTLLSIAALVCVTVYNQFNTALTELRRDLNQLQDARADLIKKDEFNSRLNAVWTGFKDLQTIGTTLSALSERYKIMEQQAEKQIKSAADERKELLHKLEEERKEMQRQLEAARKGSEDTGRKVEERLKTFLDERKEATLKLEEQVRTLTEEAKEGGRKLQVVGERLATIEGREAAAKKNVETR
jgi:hypothetical protein